MSIRWPNGGLGRQGLGASGRHFKFCLCHQNCKIRVFSHFTRSERELRQGETYCASYNLRPLHTSTPYFDLWFVSSREPYRQSCRLGPVLPRKSTSVQFSCSSFVTDLNPINPILDCMTLLGALTNVQWLFGFLTYSFPRATQSNMSRISIFHAHRSTPDTRTFRVSPSDHEL
jgi:hypothetical protein